MKINKKGFTLIELLAVIAILAILVVIAVPAVLNLFTGAQEDSFITQAKSLYKSAENQYLSNQLNPSGKTTFCSTGTDGYSTSTTELLDLTGTKTIKYKIVFNSSTNQMTAFTMTDGKRSINLSGTFDINSISKNNAGYRDSPPLTTVPSCP